MESKNDRWDMEELDTKTAENTVKEKEMMGGIFTPPHGHQSKAKPKAGMQRQVTPNLGGDENDPFSACFAEKMKSNTSRKPNKHTQEVRVMGEVDTDNPKTSPVMQSGNDDCPVTGGEVDTLDPSASGDLNDLIGAKRGDTSEKTRTVEVVTKQDCTTRTVELPTRNVLINTLFMDLPMGKRETHVEKNAERVRLPTMRRTMVMGGTMVDK